MDKSDNCEWVIIDTNTQPALQKCLRCGMIDQFPFNKPLGYALKLMQAFIDYHKDCKEPLNNEANKEK